MQIKFQHEIVDPAFAKDPQTHVATFTFNPEETHRLVRLFTKTVKAPEPKKGERKKPDEHSLVFPKEANGWPLTKVAFVDFDGKERKDYKSGDKMVWTLDGR